MNVIELKGIIAQRFGVAMSTIAAEDFKAYGVRFKYHGNMYRATTDLTIEKVDGGCLVTDDDTRQMENILRGEEWDGQGLPPAGTVCEMSYAGDAWGKCVIVATGEEQIIFRREGCREFSGHRSNYRFRPILSEADKKRDEAENSLRTCLAGTGITSLAAKSIYDAIAAGKIPGIRIE